MGTKESDLRTDTIDIDLKAHCNTESTDVSVDITKDGWPTGHTSPHTFAVLTGSHTFTVPSTDANGHPFKQWSTGETSTTVTVASSGTYTAYYQAKYILTITTATGGTTNPSPGAYTYWDGTSVSVTALSYADYKFDHWILDSSSSYFNPISVTMNTNHNLQPVFKYSPTSPVGGLMVLIDKLGLLAPYICLASTIIVATVAIAIYVKRVKHRREKQ